MAKLNLLNRAIRKKHKKRIEMKDSVWIIVNEENDKSYFVKETDETYDIVIWTDKINNAMKFHTESGCQHFAATYLASRDNFHIECVEGKQKR